MQIKNILKSSIKRNYIVNLLYFLSLYFILVFRAPEDFFSPYLWAEDGTILIESAIYDGISGVFIPGNGTYWVIQKILALLCYWVVIPSGSILLLPYLMQISFKIIAVLSIIYFVSNRFEWIIKEKFYRFIVCIFIILLMPQNSSEVLTCETALPFEMFFWVFLLGLDLLFSRKNMPNLKETFFLSLFSMSFAGAPLVFLLICVCFTFWLIKEIKNRTLSFKLFCFQFLKILALFATCIAQISVLLSGNRVNNDFDLLNRIFLNFKSFIFFPYWQIFHSWIAFCIGLLLWLLIAYASKTSWKVLLYYAGFSYIYMLYCSFTSATNSFYSGEMVTRYVFICYEISVLYIFSSIIKLYKCKTFCKQILSGSLACTFLILALKTYNVPTIGAEFAEIYEKNCSVFDKNGTDQTVIPIGPWEPWILTIPTRMSSYQYENDILFNVESIDGYRIGDENYGLIDKDNKSYIHLVGWVKTAEDNELLNKIYLKFANKYIAASKIQIRDVFDKENIKHNGFDFVVDINYLQEGENSLELVAQSENGEWHKGVITLNFSFI